VAAHFSVDPRQHLVTVKFDGPVSLNDLETYMHRLRTHPAFDATFSELVDLTEVESSQLDYKAASLVARTMDPFSPLARRAFVAPRMVIFGIIRMYQLIRDDEINTRVFRDMQEARAWLGI